MRAKDYIFGAVAIAARPLIPQGGCLTQNTAQSASRFPGTRALSRVRRGGLPN